MLITKSVQDFITELAADSAAPGGGSAAALAGCLGAALTKMVCNLSLDEAKFGAVLPEIQAIQSQADIARSLPGRKPRSPVSVQFAPAGCTRKSYP